MEIHANKANHYIRKIVNPQDVSLFLEVAPILRLLSKGDVLTDAAMQQLDPLINKAQKMRFLDAISQLSKISFTVSETKRDGHTRVISRRTLLGKLTDGASHFKIYPHLLTS